MKEKFSNISSKFSRAIIQPVMFLSVTGLVLTIGVILKMDVMPPFIVGIGKFVYNLMMNGGINQLSVIFCVGITAALAKSKKVDAAILGISSFLFFIYANNAWLSANEMLIDAKMLSGSGQAMVLGVQVVDMGVFLGIILGCLTGWIFNKFSDVEFPDAIRIYGGSRLAYMITALATSILAIALCYLWPLVNEVISTCAIFINEKGSLGLFVYGFLNRILIPTGLHHLIYTPFLLTPVGGTMEVAGQAITGAYPILMAQLGDISSVTALDPSVRYMFYGFAKIFGCIGIALAFIKTAKPHKKATTRSLLLPLLFVAVIAGVTEPLEFMFLFVSPLLWFVHAILDGLFQVVIFVLGARFQLMSGVLNAIPLIIAVPAELSKWYITFGVGIIAIFVWYFVFVILIKKFDIKTPGREDDEDEVVSTDQIAGNVEEKEALGDVNDIIVGLGGKENIISVNNCYTRLRIELKNIEKLNEQEINKFNNKGIIKKGNNVQIIIGMKVQTVREAVCQTLDIE